MRWSALLCYALGWERNEWKASPREKIYMGVLCGCNCVVLQLCCAIAQLLPLSGVDLVLDAFRAGSQEVLGGSAGGVHQGLHGLVHLGGRQPAVQGAARQG